MNRAFSARCNFPAALPIPARSSSAPRRNFPSAIRTAPPRSSSPGNMPSWRCTRRPALPVERGSIMAAFGCNFEGDIPVSRVVALVAQILDVAKQHGVTLRYVTLADTMAWATPLAIKRIGRRIARALARSRRRAAPARHARARDRQCLCRPRNGRDAIRRGGSGAGRLPVRRPCRRRRQCLHRGPRLPLRAKWASRPASISTR